MRTSAFWIWWAARVNFNKDLRQLTLAEAALLAGMYSGQATSIRRGIRNVRRAPKPVLTLMRQNGYISVDDERVAATLPVGISSHLPSTENAPYFIPLATDELQTILGPKKMGETSYRVYTTFDQRLQHAAVEAVRLGMQEVDTLLRRKGRVRRGHVPR